MANSTMERNIHLKTVFFQDTTQTNGQHKIKLWWHQIKSPEKNCKTLAGGSKIWFFIYQKTLLGHIGPIQLTIRKSRCQLKASMEIQRTLQPLSRLQWQLFGQRNQPLIPSNEKSKSQDNLLVLSLSTLDSVTPPPHCYGLKKSSSSMIIKLPSIDASKKKVNVWRSPKLITVFWRSSK